jgi:hypothetical protein
VSRVAADSPPPTTEADALYVVRSVDDDRSSAVVSKTFQSIRGTDDLECTETLMS